MTKALLMIVILFLALILTLAVFGVDPREGMKLIFEGAFGDKFGIARTLVRATPLLLCGLGVTLAWKAGMYNVGGEGQYVLGGIFGAAAAKSLSGLPAPVLSMLILLASTLGGLLLAALAGWLQVKRGVQCVISTILFNFIVLQFLAWTVRGPLQETKHLLPLSERVSKDVQLHRFDPQTDLHAGVFIAVFAVLVVAFFLGLTKSGFILKLVGQNPLVARSNRLDPGLVQIKAMAMSGALCGLAGGVDYLGLIGQLSDGFSQNWGFLAIPVALLGGLNPIGVLGTGLYFGALMAGGEGLARFNATGTTLVSVIQAVAVLGFMALTRLKRQEVVSD